MARKKKSCKGSEDECAGACGVDEAPVEPPETLDPRKTTEEDDDHHLHNSDSEVFDVKQKLQLQKNKSNLYIIKSYSFIDKSNVRRPQTLNIPQKLQEFENYHSMLLEEANSPVKVHKIKSKEKSVQCEKQDKLSKKPAKHNKLKKAKSTYDSYEDLQDYSDILRKPEVMFDCEGEGVSSSRKRPLTFPDNPGNKHKPVVKSKTMEDIETSPLIKRESFIRYSLQSIRRSFSSSKKYQISSSSSNSSASANCSSACSSSSSTSSTSSSSDTTNSFKKSKSKTKDKDKDKDKVKSQNVQVPEEPKYTVQTTIALEHSSCKEDEASLSSSSVPVVVLTSSSGLSTSSSSSSANSNSSNSNGLAVLKEEDEKDLQNPLERLVS